MKKQSGKNKKVIKGMPQAVLLSIAIHAALFFLAGMLVVFTVVKKREVEFQPPRAVERPKMKLKKPKVKVKKTSKPKPTTRIVTKMNRASMPDIQLPEMSGMSEGLGGDIGGFDMMPDLEQISVFGGAQSIGNDLEGTLYDLKRDRRGKPLSVKLGTGGLYREIEKFLKSGWKTSSLGRFYRSPEKLYTPAIVIPSVPSNFGPWAFNEPGMAAYEYLLHYKGQIVYPEGGRFRFWCMGDNFMVVRVDGQVVLDYGNQFSNSWDGEESRRTSYHIGHWPAYSGAWFDLEPGVSLDLEMIFGEAEGGLFGATLVIEQEGVKYPVNFEGGPMLPVFKTSELSRDQVDAIFEFLYEDHYSVTNGPVFSDYTVSGKVASAQEKDKTAMEEPSVENDSSCSGMRQWILKSGEAVEAELVLEIGDKVVLKTARGKQLKVPVRSFSQTDLDYLELASPPRLKIVFQKETDVFNFAILPNSSFREPVVHELTTGVKIKKINQKPYTKELKVELFSFADEIDGDNYILLDRQVGTFIPSEESGECYELWGKKTYLRDYMSDGCFSAQGQRRGERFKGHMIIVTDERGKIIAQSVSNDWMLENLDFLREFPVGRHFSKKGVRVYPPRPKVLDVFWNSNIIRAH